MTEPTTAAIVHVTANDAQLAPIVPESKIQLLKDTICKGATDGELELFRAVCNRVRLDPFAKQIHAVKRWDQKAGREVMSTQTGIDGYRLIAERTGKYAGQSDFEWCGPDGQWVDVWLADEPPAAARATVYRTDFAHPVRAVARYKAYVQTTRDGKPNSMWGRMGAEQLAKCAESLALRKAFPQELSGVYTDAEMGQADNPAETKQVTAVAKQAAPQTAADGVRFGMKWEKDWAGRLIETAPPDVIGKYIDYLAGILDDPTKEKGHKATLAHKQVVEVLYEHFMDREMAAAEARHKSTPPPAADDIADRLQQHVDEQRGTNDTATSWGLEAP